MTKRLGRGVMDVQDITLTKRLWKASDDLIESVAEADLAHELDDELDDGFDLERERREAMKRAKKRKAEEDRAEAARLKSRGEPKNKNKFRDFLVGNRAQRAKKNKKKPSPGDNT